MIKITNNIYCITTEYGGRKFNSYLICGETTVLVDSCPEERADELVEKLKEKVPKLDYVIFTHTDRYRAGAIELLSDTKVIATIAGLRNLKEIANRSLVEQPAKEGEEIDLGGISIKLMITPNLNWPDTMMIYIPEEKMLLSGTMFVGYNSGVSVQEYCNNEMRIFPEFASTALEKAAALKPEIICPSEGDIQDDDVFEIYREALMKKDASKTVAVLYAGTVNGYTATLARTTARAICDSGISAICINCREDNRDEAVEIMNSADALCFASPTIHRNAVPELMDVLVRLDCVNMRHKPCMVTGSYGWGGEALGCISNYLKLLKLKVFEKPIGCIMKPSEEKLKELTDYAKRFADFVKGINDDNN